MQTPVEVGAAVEAGAEENHKVEKKKNQSYIVKTDQLIKLEFYYRNIIFYMIIGKST